MDIGSKRAEDMKGKKVLVFAIILFLLLAGGVVFYLSRPSVSFVSSGSFPDGYELPEPGNIFEYRVIRDASSADLVIVAPDAVVPSGIDSYLFGREAAEGESPIAVLAIDEPAMWESALSGNDVLLYEGSSNAAVAISDHLKSIEPGIKVVTYSGRISNANIDQIRKALEESGAERILALTPSTSMELFRSSHPWHVVMDVRDAAAMETTAVDEAVSIDWDESIENLFSGQERLSYCSFAL